MNDLRILWAFVPFALLVLVGRKLPSRLWSAILASALAGVAAGTASLGALFSLLGFFSLAPDPNQILIIVVVTLLMLVHWAMLQAEASVANYIIGKGAAYSSPHRERFAMIGGAVGHAIWWYMAYRYMNPTLQRDEFSGLFFDMILPTAALAAPGATIGALLSPRT